MSVQSDQADIEAFMRAAGVAAVASALRSHGGELVPAQQPGYFEGHDPSRYVVDNVGRRASAPRYATVHPVTRPQGSEPARRRYSLGRPAILLGGLVVAVLLGWWVVSVVLALATAAATAVSTVLPLLAVVGIVILLSSLCGGRGGGRSVSGTWQGRIH